MKKISSITSICMTVAVLTPVLVFAQTTPAPATTNTTAVSSGPEFSSPTVNSTYTLLEPLPCIPGTGNSCTTGSTTASINIQTYIIYVYKLMIALAVLAAVIMCIVGGFEYMITDSISTKVDAKETIKNAILGLVAALASYLILYTINPNLVNVSLVTVPKLNVTATNINLSPTAIDTSVAAGQQAAAALTQDAQLAQQAQTDLDQADTLSTQLSDNNCVDDDGNLLPNASASCQTEYNQFTAAESTYETAESTAITTQAQNVFGVTATAAKAAIASNDPGKVTLEETLNTSEYNTDMAQLKENNDIAGEQTLTQSYNQAQAPLQNSATVLNYQDQPYDSQAQASAAADSAIATINANTFAAEKNVTDPTVLQQIAASGKSAQDAIRAAHPAITAETPIVP